MKLSILMLTKAVFFDLDGTLLNTFPDLLSAANQQLIKYHRPVILEEEAKKYLYHGSTALINYLFEELSHEDRQKLYEEYLKIYKECMTKKTHFYPGILETLNFLDEKKIPWGVITNKMYFLAAPLLQHFNLMNRALCLVGPETVNGKRKPDPDPLLYACKLAKIKPEEAVYVGDTYTDTGAAKAAHMPMVLVRYGYMPDYQELSHEADYCIDKGTELLVTLQKYF